MTAECTAGRGGNPVDRRINALLGSVSRWSALIVGALTVVLSNGIAEALPVANFYRALALFPIALATMYALLALAARLERRSR